MNRLAIGSLALFAFAGGTSLAVAADLPMKALAYPAPPGLDASWSGFYAGVSFGGRWSDTVWTTNCIGQLAPGGLSSFCNPNATPALLGVQNPQSFDSATARIGGYLGYNWQFARAWVLGVEGDFAWGESKRMVAGIPGAHTAGSATAAFDSTAVKLGWDASVRARIGYLINSTTLIYATGGIAFQQLEIGANCPTTGFWCGGVVPAVQPAAENVTATRAGWTIGGGAEAMFWGKWLVRAEYRFADYGNFNHTFFPAATGGGLPAGQFAVGMTESLKTHTFLVGLGYKFEPAAVAKF